MFSSYPHFSETDMCKQGAAENPRNFNGQPGAGCEFFRDAADKSAANALFLLLRSRQAAAAERDLAFAGEVDGFAEDARGLLGGVEAV